MHNKIRTGAVMLTACSLVAIGFISDGVFKPSPVGISPTPGEANSIILQAEYIAEVTHKEFAPAQPVASKSARTVSTVSKPTYPDKRTASGEIEYNDARYPIRQYKALGVPNDPSGSQWWVTQTGLPAAWDNGNGQNTKIAIIDTGFALQHEEFTGRWLDNDTESGVTLLEATAQPNCTNRGLDLDKSCNGIDDDQNGFVDDFRGWDFESDEPSVQAGEVNPAGGGVRHGTAVTGVAAASGNNNVGIAGVSWGTKILPLQALSDEGSGDTLGIARAIRYAADRDVDIINLSLGSEQEDSYLRQAIKYALDRGSIVVAAAGNDGCNCISYPARYPEVVAVGASRSDGSVASFSSFGSSLDIIAPGAGMRLPVWDQSQPANAYASGLAGTSFASPYVSGLLANAKAKQPTASWGQLVNIVLQTADHSNLTVNSPRSDALGAGFVKADAALARLSAPYSQTMRYGFSTSSLDTLGANTVAQCEVGQFPTAAFYEIRNGALIFYTISELTAASQRANGGTVSFKGYTCVGLPTDTSVFSRLIDPVREFSNSSTK